MNQDANEEISEIGFELKSFIDLCFIITSIVEQSHGKLKLSKKSFVLAKELFIDAEFLALVKQCLDKREYNDLRELGTSFASSRDAMEST